jgi:hypothetical protein
MRTFELEFELEFEELGVPLLDPNSDPRDGGRERMRGILIMVAHCLRRWDSWHKNKYGLERGDTRSFSHFFCKKFSM